MITITLPPPLIGLYSPRAARLFGTAVYYGIDGKEHHITCAVANEDKIPKYKWDDTVRIGYMTHYLRQGGIIMDKPLYRYTAFPIRAIDGDTIEVNIQLGFNIDLIEHVRLSGVNTPELKGPDSIRAKEAKEFTTNWLREATGLYIQSNKFNSREKYGRILATVFRDSDPVSLNDAIIAQGLGIRYE